MKYNGLDLSSYQKGINFDIIQKNGIDFIILRGGYTGWGTGKSYYKDSCFDDFYFECKKRKIPVGVYWYSCANSYELGKAEAQFLYNKCLKGKFFEYPIYIDVEDSHHQLKSKQGTTNAICGFCETLEKLGFYAGVYANRNWFTNYIYLNQIKQFDKWIAVWGKDKPTFTFFGVWQNSDTGRIGGKRVDTDIAYINYPEIIKNKGLNGYGKSVQKKKTNEQIAKEVIQGKWGNGKDRKDKLTKAGYNYAEIQKIVNKILR